MTDDCALVIFGATGNLAQIKLLPALYQLEAAGLLDPGVKILCNGRTDFDTDSWLHKVRAAIDGHAREPTVDRLFERFAARIRYLRGDISQPDFYVQLRQELGSDWYPRNLVFYVALPPAGYGTVVESLGQAGMLDEAAGPWRRVVIEKPFGSDLHSAQDLQARIARYLAEKQIYRIDHYMGKAMVQNVLVSRFANLLLEPLWNRNYIDHVQITRTESHGVGQRAGFYEQAGALRDMLQSHLMQMMALVAMEPPVSMDSDDLRDEKVKVLKAIRPIAADQLAQAAFRAQYGPGEVEGESVPGYLQEPGVDPRSTTETYAALKLYVDNWRWRGVPFYLRTGKRMSKPRTMVAIRFKEAPLQFFRSAQVECPSPNWLIMSMSPHEALRLEITVKEPGMTMDTCQISLEAPFRCEHHQQTGAYEGLLLDVMEGDNGLFLRYDEVEYAWRVVDPVLHAWEGSQEGLASYPAGGREPAEVSRLFDRPDHQWRSALEPAQ